MGGKRPRVPLQLPIATAQLLRSLTERAQQQGWESLGCQRAGAVTQVEVVAEALRLLATQAAQAGGAQKA